ncbi:MAG: GNAT family N-acetyltransferase, partial [Anaerolineales bacterium]
MNEQIRNSRVVRVLRPAEGPIAGAILARAFDQEAAKLIMLPDERLRHTFLEWTVNARLFDAMRYGTVHGAQVDGELGAIALWIPPGVPALSLSGAVRAKVALLSKIASLARAFPNIVRVLLSDLSGAIALARERRPAVINASRGMSWRLDLLGTLPVHRRKGLARMLLEKQLTRCDQDGAAVWLEATDPVNPDIYERFGFDTIAHIEGPT